MRFRKTRRRALYAPSALGRKLFVHSDQFTCTCFANKIDIVYGGSCPQLQTKSRTRPGSHRIVRLIGRQQTVQSSIIDCSDCEVSICNGKTSPQCGQVISVSTINSTFRHAALVWSLSFRAPRPAWSSLPGASLLPVFGSVIASLAARRSA